MPTESDQDLHFRLKKGIVEKDHFGGSAGSRPNFILIFIPYMMQRRQAWMTVLLILTSLMGYMAWGPDSHAFLFQAEGEVLRKLFTDPGSTLHPLILIPLASQIVLLTTLFQRTSSRWWRLAGILGLGLLMVMILIAGILSQNLWQAMSTLPFLAISFLVIRADWRPAAT